MVEIVFGSLVNEILGVSVYGRYYTALNSPLPCKNSDSIQVVRRKAADADALIVSQVDHFEVMTLLVFRSGEDFEFRLLLCFLGILKLHVCHTKNLKTSEML